MPSMKPTKEGYVEGILQAGRENDRVVVIEGDVSRSTGGASFGEEFPDRFFNLGISEQDMLGEAAGFALAGFIPFVSTYAVFVAGRAWDQIRTGICYMDLPVKIGGAHSGISVGPDGATHQALEDIAIMRVLPNMKVLVPADANQTRAAVLTSLKTNSPVYIRFGRNPVPQIYPVETRVEIGKGHLLAEGSDVLIVACGAMVSSALAATVTLKEKGITVGVIDMVSVKPLDADLLITHARKTRAVIVAEDHQMAGGLFGAVAELLGRNCPVKLDSVSVQDSFGTSGTPESVLSKYGLTANMIVRKAMLLMLRRL